MNEETSSYDQHGIAEDGSPLYDEYLPGPVQVLVEWLILIVSTLITFFQRKSGE